MAEKEQLCLDNLRGFITFLAFSGCGHSLVSSILDAHKDIAISREMKILPNIYSGKYGREVAFNAIPMSSRRYTTKGRPHKGSNTYHLVPGQFNGQVSSPLFIGDKNGQGTIAGIVNKEDFLRKVVKAIQVPLYFIHIHRNPADLVAHTRKFCTSRSTRKTIIAVAGNCARVDKAVTIVSGKFNLISIKIEEFVADFDSQMSRLSAFLRLKFTKDYLDSCKKVLIPSALDEKNDIEWSKGCLSLLHTKFGL